MGMNKMMKKEGRNMAKVSMQRGSKKVPMDLAKGSGGKGATKSGGWGFKARGFSPGK